MHKVISNWRNAFNHHWFEPKKRKNKSQNDFDNLFFWSFAEKLTKTATNAEVIKPRFSWLYVVTRETDEEYSKVVIWIAWKDEIRTHMWCSYVSTIHFQSCWRQEFSTVEWRHRIRRHLRLTYIFKIIVKFESNRNRNNKCISKIPIEWEIMHFDSMISALIAVNKWNKIIVRVIIVSCENNTWTELLLFAQDQCQTQCFSLTLALPFICVRVRLRHDSFNSFFFFAISFSHILLDWRSRDHSPFQKSAIYRFRSIAHSLWNWRTKRRMLYALVVFFIYVSAWKWNVCEVHVSRSCRTHNAHEGKSKNNRKFFVMFSTSPINIEIVVPRWLLILDSMRFAYRSHLKNVLQAKNEWSNSNDRKMCITLLWP